MAETKTNKMVTIHLRKAPMGEPNHVIASFNGEVFKIQRGVDVAVPEEIAEIIQDSLNAQDRADDYIESLVSKKQK